MIYKTLKKVSDVCQLLNKSEYPEVITNAGVTTTSNGDGSITINGTATKSSYINCTPPYPQKNNGHVFYICANNTTMSYSTWSYGLLNQNTYDYGNGVIGRTNASRERNTGIAFNKGVVFDNVIIKPQIIDLTEMYGAGNEPTTVEQFRQDFPEELYDYKPYCFVKSYKTLLKATDDKIITSYKKSLACKTKNLFDYTKVNGLEHTTTGNPNSNYLKINGESFGVMVGMYDRGVNFIPHFILDAGTYTMSLIAKGTSPGDTGQFGIIKFNGDGTKPSFTKQWVTFDSRQSYTFTLDENSEIAIRVQAYGNASNANNLDSTFSNIQLELGDTATEYHPYGYL